MIQIPPEWLNLPNSVIAAKLGVTRQAILYARRRASGRCQQCNKPIAKGSLCPKHATKRSTYQRKRTGYRPWKAGGRGRPPIHRKEPQQ